MKDLEDYILEIFGRIELGTKLRWFQIRNELLRNEKLNPSFAKSKKDTSFNVKVMRALNRLEKQGILDKHVEGHKNTSYSLSENAPQKILERVREIGVVPTIGLFSPDDLLNLSYEKVKAKLVEHAEKVFEWKKSYEEARKYVMEKRKYARKK